MNKLSSIVVAAALTAILSTTSLAGSAVAEERQGERIVEAGEQRPGCLIKGNINSRGERIYHEPGGRWYDRTQVDVSKGQRWFCSREEAEAAGWRRAGS